MIFQLTRSVGSVTQTKTTEKTTEKISTHTLRGERDVYKLYKTVEKRISTHTLRGERDLYTNYK